MISLILFQAGSEKACGENRHRLSFPPRTSRPPNLLQLNPDRVLAAVGQRGGELVFAGCQAAGLGVEVEVPVIPRKPKLVGEAPPIILLIDQ